MQPPDSSIHVERAPRPLLSTFPYPGSTQKFLSSWAKWTRRKERPRSRRIPTRFAELEPRWEVLADIPHTPRMKETHPDSVVDYW